MDWKILGVTFATIFLAELGDKTQIACILMAAKTARPLTVFVGASLALTAVTAVGVIFAAALTQYLNPALIKKIAAAGFVVIGALMFAGKL